MKRMMLTSAAVAALALCGAVAGAQPSPDRQDRAPSATQQQSAPAPAEQLRRGATESRDGRTGQADRAGRTTGQASDERQPSAGGAQGEDRRPSRAEQRRSGEQVGDRQDSAAGRSAQQEGRDQQRTRRSDDVRQGRERSARDRDRDRTMSRDADRQQTQSSERMRSQDRSDRAARSNEGSARGELSMSQDQRTRVSARFDARIDRMNIRPLSRTNISVSIGAAVPRSIRLYDVPSDIVAIYPRFRGYRFVVVEDEVVIVEPRSRKVVTVLPYQGKVARGSSRSTTGVAVSNDRIRLAPEVRSEIRTVVMREAACRYEPRLDFTLGIPLPRSVQVCEFPQEIVSDVPEIRNYRYVVKGDDVIVVDPDEYRVVEVIR